MEFLRVKKDNFWVKKKLKHGNVCFKIKIKIMLPFQVNEGGEDNFWVNVGNLFFFFILIQYSQLHYRHC